MSPILATARNQVAHEFSIPAPVGGWNTRDALDAMSPNDAVTLDNWIPAVGAVMVRKGYASHATGMGTNVDTLAEYHSGATQKLIAAGNGNIWDATSVGAASSLASGFTNNQWQTANFSGRMFFVNGTDVPQDYDGSSVSATAWSGSGLTIADLIGVNVFKERLFFWEDDSQDFWYATSAAITGTLTKFPLSRVGQFGGNLVAMGTWTLDGGSGIDDYAVFIMSSGEVIIYQGTDPGVAANWSMVGIYRIGVPLGVRGVVKSAGDLIVMTRDDYVPLSTVLKSGQVGVASKLSGAVTTASSNSSGFGWQATLHRTGNLLLFNVPKIDGTYDQHVINTITGAPCRFTGIPSRCWAVYNGSLYFGSTDGVVYKYTGDDDNGAAIGADAEQAWTDGGMPRTKKMSTVRAVIKSVGTLNYEIGIGTDFSKSLTPSATTSESSGPSWDTTAWDTVGWGAASVINSTWKIASGEGQNISTRLRVNTKQETSWLRTDFRAEIGTGL